ncbi:MAG: SulP family inorganic anion transporter, partial [Verrucomicrobiota bacterium]
MIPWRNGYRTEWLRHDVIAGLTTGAVVIPKAMAYATIAGLPVEVGLYTAFAPMLIYALSGSSRTLSVSTSTTIAILVGSQLNLLVPDGGSAALLRASATLALTVGAILMLAAALRLGFVANFISESVLVGFKAGIGVVIIVDQLPKLLGFHIPRGTFLVNLLSIAKGIPGASLPTVGVALVMIALLVALERWAPRVPAPLVAVAAGIGGTAAFGLSSLGVEAVGHVPQGLPALALP